MKDMIVRMVTLPTLRVASALGFGASPEAIANEKISAFCAEKGLKRGNVYVFGFNNPNPSPGSPNYGYEAWVTVGPEVEASGDITIKEVPGGTYAVTRFRGLDNIGRVWQELVLWCEERGYQCSGQQCLEELLTPANVPFDEYIFDLYQPVIA